MTRVLILGAGGMLGHKLWQVLRHRFDVYATVRQDYQAYAPYQLFNAENLRTGVDALQFSSVVATVQEIQPDVVVNCIGMIKQLPLAEDPVGTIEINSLFPHRLAQICAAMGVWLIHLSTDCVFSGRKGHYTEDDVPDPDDLYGRTKLLGEVSQDGCITLRTSMIGRELRSRTGLLEWFLAQQGIQVQGYVNAVFSGFTTLALARILGDLIDGGKGTSGLHHLSAEPINKYDLLLRLRQAFGLQIEIEPYKAYHCDRSLDSTRFRFLTGFIPPTWDQMLEDLVEDDVHYQQWRRDIGS